MGRVLMTFNAINPLGLVALNYARESFKNLASVYGRKKYNRSSVWFYLITKYYFGSRASTSSFTKYILNRDLIHAIIEQKFGTYIR